MNVCELCNTSVMTSAPRINGRQSREWIIVQDLENRIISSNKTIDWICKDWLKIENPVLIST